MPTLKHLTCSLEWTGSKIPLREYRTAYTDGRVETFVAIPSIPTPFSVRLRSHGYIAPGLAMFVYMDGDYQCNRNRRNLKIPDGNTPRKETEINFNVRQKEDMMEDGTFAAKEWSFKKLNIVPVMEDSKNLSHKAPHDAEYVGMIEVVVLRCHPVSAQPDCGKAQGPQSRSKNTPTEAIPVGKVLKVATSLPLSDDSSASSGTSGPFIGMSDGAADEALRGGTVMPFGGDAGWDNPLPQASKGTQHQGASLPSPDASFNKVLNDGSHSAAGSVVNSQWHGRTQSRSYFEQDWSQSGRPSSDISQSRHLPQTQAQGKSGGVTGNEAANRSVSESKLSAPGNTRGPARSGPSLQGTPVVISDMNQADPLAGLWGARVASPAVSEADSWATRKTPFDFGELVCQARQEPQEPRRPNTSWQAPATWGEGSRSGQLSDHKQEFPKGSTNTKSLANPLTSSDANIVGNKGSKDAPSDTVDTGTAGGGWPITTASATSGPSRIRESNKRNSWDSISPTGGMPGAWWSNDDEKVSNTTDWGRNAVGDAHQTQSPSGRGNEGSTAVQKQSDGAQGPAVVDSNEQHWGEKKGAVPSGFGIDGNPNTHGSSWGEPIKIQSSVDQSEDKAGPSALEVKVSSGSETNVSKSHWGGEMAQSTGWDVPPNKGQERPGFLDKVKSRLGSPSPPTNGTNLAKRDKNQSEMQEMPGTQTRSESGPCATGKSSSPTLLSRTSHQLQANPSKQRPQQASVVVTGQSPLTAAEVYRKPYWSAKSTSSARPQSTTGDGHSDTYLGTEDALYTIPEEVVQRKYVSHQVHQGRPVLYAHKTAKPKYMDSHERPYAVFVFNYRSEDAIKKMLSIEVTEDEDEEKTRLHALSKAELIEHFMRAKAKETNPQPDGARGWQNVSSPENVAGSASVTSPKGVNSQEAWTTKDNKNNSTVGIGIDLKGVTEDVSPLQMSPKNASDNACPNPDTLWGREEVKPGRSITNAGDWNSKSNNNPNNNGGNWTTSGSNNGNNWSGGGGGPTGSPQAQRNTPSTAGNHGAVSVSQNEKSNGGKWNSGNSNIGNNWGGGSRNKDSKDGNGNAGNNWGGGSPTGQDQNHQPNASGNDWGGSGGETKHPSAGGGGSGGGWAGDGGQSKNWGGDGGTKGGWANGGGAGARGGDDGKVSGGAGKGSGGDGNNWGGSGQNGQGGDSQW